MRCTSTAVLQQNNPWDVSERSWKPSGTARVTRRPTVAHLAILRTGHDRVLLRCIGRRRKRRDAYHMLSYADELGMSGGENVETTV